MQFDRSRGLLFGLCNQFNDLGSKLGVKFNILPYYDFDKTGFGNDFTNDSGAKVGENDFNTLISSIQSYLVFQADYSTLWEKMHFESG